MFCAWGAEEHGLIGSTEWVEVQILFISYKELTFLSWEKTSNQLCDGFEKFKDCG